MAFWGIEIRPGKPYTHLYDNARGRLRISQATLGNGKSTGKSVVQCNVGNRSPVLLCTLIPNGSETCHLELEFEEDDEVIFSVLGQRSVHLSGYFLGSGRGTGGDETDSYGEDIAESETDNSGSSDSFDSEDEYESDFIDDGDVEMFSSPQRRSSVIIEEIFDDEKPANGNTSRRRLKKKYHVSDSDGDNAQNQLVVKGNGSTVLESEDEDGFPISVTLRKKNAVNNAQGNARSDDKTLDEERKRKIDAISQDPESARESCQPCDPSTQPESGAVNSGKSKKKKKDKDRKLVETDPKSSAEEIISADQNQAPDGKAVGTVNGDQIQLGKARIDIKDVATDVDGVGNDRKLKKKKKERVKKGKTSETGVDLSDLSAERTEGKGKGDSSEALNNANLDQNLPSILEPEKLATDEDMVDHSLRESSGKLKNKNKNKKRRQKDESQQATEDKIDTDDIELQNSKDMSPDVNAEPAAAAVNQNVAKNKKKKKSKNIENDSTTKQESADMIAAEEETFVVDEKKGGKRPLKTREYPNGLTVEEISMGKPDGKRASRGNKVFVQYIGKLQNGKIFDSNTGQKPFSFRLGIGQVIKGWDVGLNGMRVGDKRRLVIPPSMGYGESGAGKKIPGNSWLVFEIELVDVK